MNSNLSFYLQGGEVVLTERFFIPPPAKGIRMSFLLDLCYAILRILFAVIKGIWKLYSDFHRKYGFVDELDIIRYHEERLRKEYERNSEEGSSLYARSVSDILKERRAPPGTPLDDDNITLLINFKCPQALVVTDKKLSLSDRKEMIEICIEFSELNKPNFLHSPPLEDIKRILNEGVERFCEDGLYEQRTLDLALFDELESIRKQYGWTLLRYQIKPHDSSNLTQV